MKKSLLSIVAAIAMVCPLAAVEQSSAMEVSQSLLQSCIDQDTITYICCVSPGLFAQSAKNKALNALMDSLHQKMTQAYQGCSAAEKQQIFSAVAAQISPQTVSSNGKWYLGNADTMNVDHSSAEAVAACMIWSCFAGDEQVAMECLSPSMRSTAGKTMSSDILQAQRMFSQNLKSLPLENQIPAIYALISNMQKNAKKINGKWYINSL